MLNLSGPERPARPPRSRQRRRVVGAACPPPDTPAPAVSSRAAHRRRRDPGGAPGGGRAAAALVRPVVRTRRPADAVAEARPAEGPLVNATLFYLARDGTGLVGRERRVEPGTDATARAQAIVRRQLDPAPPPLYSPFPEGTSLRSLYVRRTATRSSISQPRGVGRSRRRVARRALHGLCARQRADAQRAGDRRRADPGRRAGGRHPRRAHRSAAAPGVQPGLGGRFFPWPGPGGTIRGPDVATASRAGG